VGHPAIGAGIESKSVLEWRTCGFSSPVLTLFSPCLSCLVPNFSAASLAEHNQSRRRPFARAESVPGHSYWRLLSLPQLM
jgi:hypothetical protein